ncbi:MAG: hypothetical protein ACFFB5_23380 [Promethearchaeota archaeon]
MKLFKLSRALSTTTWLSLIFSCLILSSIAVNSDSRSWNVGKTYSYKGLTEVKEDGEHHQREEKFQFRIEEIKEKTIVTYVDMLTSKGRYNRTLEFQNDIGFFRGVRPCELKVLPADCVTPPFPGIVYTDILLRYGIDSDIYGIYDMPMPLFINPEWDLINSYLKNIGFNPDTYIYRSQTDYQTKVTLGEFLNQASSYEIMGKTNITEALDLFTNSTREWWWEFHFNNIVRVRKQGAPIHADQPRYKTYDLSVNIKYSEGGILETFQAERGYSYENESFFSFSKDFTIDQPSLGIPGFDFFSVTMAVLLTTGLIVQRRRRSLY